MALGLFLIQATLIVAASKVSPQSCSLPPDTNYNVSAGANRADCCPGQPAPMTLEEGQLRQISLAHGLLNSGSDSTEARDMREEEHPPEERDNGSISGTVTDENGEVIPGAEVGLDTDTPSRQSRGIDSTTRSMVNRAYPSQERHAPL